MYHFHSLNLPVSTATEQHEIFLEVNKETNSYTSTINRDREKIAEIETLMTAYESQWSWTKENLTDLFQRINKIHSIREERVDLEIRIYYLEKLYELKDKVSQINDIEEIELLNKTFKHANSSLIKQDVMNKLNEQRVKLQTANSRSQSEPITSLGTHSIEELYELVKEKFDRQIAKVGKNACNLMIKDMLNLKPSLSSVTEFITLFEKKAKEVNDSLLKLNNAENAQDVLYVLNVLPIVNYNKLDFETKDEIASNLFTGNELNVDIPRLTRLVNVEVIKIRKKPINKNDLNILSITQESLRVSEDKLDTWSGSTTLSVNITNAVN